MHLTKKVQVKIKALLFIKVLIIVFLKYFNYNNIFFIENAIKLLKYTIINNYIIKLKKSK